MQWKLKIGITIVFVLIIAGAIFYYYKSDKELLEEIKDLDQELFGPVSLRAEEGGGGVFIGEGSTDWDFDIIEDPKEEVDANITQINQTVLELTLFEHENANLAGGYKWNMALCNITGGGLEYMNEDAQGGFDNAIPLSVIFGKLTDFGMNETWCDDQNGEGYVLFSNGAKNELPKKIRLLMNDIEDFKLFGGTGSIILDGSAAQIATNKWQDSICQTSDGTLHVAWEGGASDLWYGNSTDTGATWTTKEILQGTVNDASVLCNSTGYVMVIYTSGQNIDAKHSSDDFSSTTTILDNATDARTAACNIDGKDEWGCSVRSSDNGLYHWWTNVSNYPNGETLATVASGNDCDDGALAFDSNNEMYFICIGSQQADLDSFSTADGMTRIEVLASSAYTAGHGTDIAISNDDNIYVCVDQGNDIQFCNTSVANYPNWNCQEIHTSAGTQCNIAITENDEVIITYASAITDNGDIFIANSTDLGFSFITNRTQLPSESTSGFGSMAYTNHPESNNITDIVHFIYTSTADVRYANFSVDPPAAAGGDLCDCPALNEDFAVPMDEFCIFDSDCDLGTGKLSFTGTGNMSCNAVISTTSLGELAADQTIYIESSCRILVA